MALTVGLVMMITVAAFEALAIGTVLPKVKDDLGDVALYGWVFSAFLLTSLVGITFAGEQADQYGPGRPYAIGLTLFAIGLAIGGFAPSMEVLVAGRAIQGIGAGAIPPVAYVAVARAYPESARPRMFALFSTAWVLPGLVGPALAGAGAEYLTWRVVFIAILPLVGAAALLTLPALRRIGPPPPGEANDAPDRSRVPVSLALAAGAGLLLGGISLRSAWFSPPLVLAGLAVSAPALHRLTPSGTFRAARGLPAAIVGIGALNWAFFATDAFIPFMLTEVRGTSTLVAGFVITSATLSWSAGTWIVDQTATRFQRRSMVCVGFALIVVGIAGLVPVLHGDVPVGVTVLTWAIGGLGIGIAYPNFSLITLAEAPTAEVGMVSSAVKLTEALSAAMGTGIAGAIVAGGEAGEWLSPALGLSFALAAAMAFAGIGLSRRLPANEPGAGERPSAARVPEPQASPGG